MAIAGSSPFRIRVGPNNFPSVSYSGDEGVGIGPPGGAMYWQSSFATVDGSLIEWGTGDHGIGSDNSVREYDPVTKTQSYAEPRQTYDEVVNGEQIVGAIYGYPTQYDNLHYFYVHALDALVIPGTGVYDRGASEWTHANRAEANITANVATSSGNSVVDGQPLGWKGDPVVGEAPTSLIRPIGSMLTNPGFPAEYYGNFNPHQAWSEALDAGVKIGGAQGGNPPIPKIWIVAPSSAHGSYPQRYVVDFKEMPETVDGAVPYMSAGRDGCCFVGSTVYWVGGWNTGPDLPHFFRLDLSPHVTSFAESLAAGPGAIERLPDCPHAFRFGLLRYDPFAYALACISDKGIAIFDLISMAWGVVTPPEYAAFFYDGKMPNGCVGDFIASRNGVELRRFYWRAGQGEAWPYDAEITTKQRTFHSLQLVR